MTLPSADIWNSLIERFEAVQVTALRNVGWARVESSKEKAIRVIKKINFFSRHEFTVALQWRMV